jgi:hypothetical protein
MSFTRLLKKNTNTQTGKGRNTTRLYDASITPVPKPDKDTTQNENYRLVSLMNIDAKFSMKYLQTEFGMLKWSYTMIKLINVTQIYRYNMAYKQIFLM